MVYIFQAVITEFTLIIIEQWKVQQMEVTYKLLKVIQQYLHKQTLIFLVVIVIRLMEQQLTSANGLRFAVAHTDLTFATLSEYPSSEELLQQHLNSAISCRYRPPLKTLRYSFASYL